MLTPQSLGKRAKPVLFLGLIRGSGLLRGERCILFHLGMLDA